MLRRINPFPKKKSGWDILHKNILMSQVKYSVFVQNTYPDLEQFRLCLEQWEADIGVAEAYLDKEFKPGKNPQRREFIGKQHIALQDGKSKFQIKAKLTNQRNQLDDITKQITTQLAKRQIEFIDAASPVSVEVLEERSQRLSVISAAFQREPIETCCCGLWKKSRKKSRYQELDSQPLNELKKSLLE